MTLKGIVWTEGDEEEWKTVECEIVVRGHGRNRKVKAVDRTTRVIVAEYAIKPNESDADAKFRIMKKILEEARNAVITESDEVSNEKLLEALPEEEE